MVKNFTASSAVSSSDGRVDDILETLEFPGDGTITLKGDILPDTTNTHDIGSSSLRCNTLYTTDGNVNNFLTMPDGSSNTKGIGSSSTLHIRFLVGQNTILFHNGGADRYLFGTTAVYPNSSLAYDLGLSSFRWNVVYCNAVNQLSDGRVKTNIKPLRMGIGFINKLNPVAYELTVGNNTESKRLGFLAQDVEKVLAGYTDMDNTTLLQISNKGEESEQYSLCYTELIAPLVSAVQDLSKEVKKLKKEIDLLKTQ